MADLFAHMQTLSRDELASTLSSSTALMRSDLQSGLGLASKIAARVATVAGEAFRLEDEAVKAVAFMQRTQQFMNIMNETESRGESQAILEKYLNEETRGELTTEELGQVQMAMDMAEKNVIATFPTFSQAPEFVKRLSRHPVLGAFPTFQAEMLRNTVNQYAFAGKLVAGIMPDGTRVEGKALGKARALGVGLLVQQGLVNGGQLVVMSALNVLAMRGKAGNDDDESGEAAANSVLEQMGNMLENYNIYPYKNVIASFHKNAAIALLPNGVDTEKGTFTYLNLGWTVPEGAWIEAGYTWANDIAEVMSNDEYTEEHKLRTLGVILGSLGRQMGGIFANEEVLFRSLYKNITERDGAEPESLGSSKAMLTRMLNQSLREASRGGDDPYSYDDGTGTNEVVKVLVGGLASVLSNLPPTTTASQIDKAVRGVIEARELNDDLGSFATQLAADGLATAAGVRMVTFDYGKEYPKTLMFTQLPNLKSVSEDLRENLFSPKKEYTKEEFQHIYRLQEGYRRINFEAIANGFSFGENTLGRDYDQLEQVWKDGNSGRDAKVEGFDFDDFVDHQYGSTYTPLGMSARQTDNKLAQWMADGSRTEDEFWDRLEWIEEAQAEAYD
jgi:hypothetical protein